MKNKYWNIFFPSRTRKYFKSSWGSDDILPTSVIYYLIIPHISGEKKLLHMEQALILKILTWQNKSVTQFPLLCVHDAKPVSVFDSHSSKHCLWQLCLCYTSNQAAGSGCSYLFKQSALFHREKNRECEMNPEAVLLVLSSPSTGSTLIEKERKNCSCKLHHKQWQW